MKREILFRGKRVDNGEWIIGSLIIFGERTFIYPTNGSQEDYHFYGYEVIAETVGQFTGLIDKNGVKIFEWDVVKGYGKFKDVVKYEYGYVSWDDSPITIDFDDPDTIQETSKWAEVIGNIHDNLELL